MSPTEPALVVDFGTTTSTAALLVDGNVRLLRERATGWSSWPSAVCLAGDTLLVGTPAEWSKESYPGAYRNEYKRDLGENTRIPLGEKSYAPQDLVVELLKSVLTIAEPAVAGPLRHLVLTIPSSYAEHDPRRDLMIEAGERAGFVEVELLAEPIGAALAPLDGVPLESGSVVLVYDLGGGTFDAAAVRLTDAGNEVLACGSREHCGGRDVDKALEDMIVETAGDPLRQLIDRARQPADTPERLAARRARHTFTDLIQRIKHQLSDAPAAPGYFAPTELEVQIQALDLTTRIAPLIQETIDCCREVLTAGKLRTSDVAAVLLVGGATRMPVVAETLRRELGLPVRATQDPSTAVAQGAAEWSRTRVDRLLTPAPLDEHAVPLRWEIRGGSATVVRWLVDEGATVARDQPLMILRTVDGMLARLSSGATEGTLIHRHGDPGETVVSGQWLAALRRPTVRERPKATATPPKQATTKQPQAEGKQAAEPSKRATDPPPRNSTLLEHGCLVTALTFDAKGTLLIAAGTDGVVRVWDTRSLKENTHISTDGAVAALAYWNGRVIIAHPDSRLEMFALDTSRRIWAVHSDATALSVDGVRRRIAMVSSTGVIQLRSADAGNLIDSLTGCAAAFDNTGDCLACGTNTGVIGLREGKDLAEYRKIMTGGGPVSRIVFDPGKNWLAVSLQGGNIAVRSLPDGRGRPGLRTGDDVVAMATAVGHGGTLLAARTEHSAYVWSVGSSIDQLLAFRTSGGVPSRPANATLALSPTGRNLATDGPGGTIRLTPVPER